MKAYKIEYNILLQEEKKKVKLEKIAFLCEKKLEDACNKFTGHMNKKVDGEEFLSYEIKSVVEKGDAIL